MDSEDLLSLQRQLNSARENLRLIQERKAEYVLSTDAPLQLIREERDWQKKIAELEHQIAEYSATTPPTTSDAPMPVKISTAKLTSTSSDLFGREPAPTVFISYSHKDEDWKDRLVTHLGVLQQEDLISLWDDRRIEAGADWQPEIEQAMQAASVAVLLVSANFLTSKFILGEEVPRLLARRDKEGMRVFPIIVKPCAWKQVSWLSRLQVRPKDGKPLSGGTDYQIDVDLAAIAEEIAAIVTRTERPAASTSTVTTSPKREVPTAPLSPSELRQKLIQSFNDSELHDLSVDLGIDYESIAGNTRDAKARELISYLQRRDRLGELISLCRERRPNVSWGS